MSVSSGRRKPQPASSSPLDGAPVVSASMSAPATKPAHKSPTLQPDIDELDEASDVDCNDNVFVAATPAAQTLPSIAQPTAEAAKCDVSDAAAKATDDNFDDDESRFNGPIHFIADGDAAPILGIFLCEFHSTAGPRITVQDPSGFIGKELFDTVSRYIIPNTQLQRTRLSVTLLGQKILGYPVRIAGQQYPRNAFYFNVCFVFDPHRSCTAYEPIVRKLTEHLLLLEESERLLSTANESSPSGKRLHALFHSIRTTLNLRNRCMPMIGARFVPLCVARSVRLQEHIVDRHTAAYLDPRYSAPSTSTEALRTGWDLTSQRIAPFLNGYNHLARIAQLTEVHEKYVVECVRDMVRLGIAHPMPVFQFNNVYRPTPKLSQLAKCKPLQERCLRECSIYPLEIVVPGSLEALFAHYEPSPTVRDCFRMFASMAHGATFGELCVRFRPRTLFIDERRLVRFGLIEGLIRRVDRYPVTVSRNLFGDAPSVVNAGVSARITDAGYRASKPLRRGAVGGETGLGTTKATAVRTESGAAAPFYDGRKTLDELCCRIGISVQKLEAQLLRDRHVIVLLK